MLDINLIIALSLAALAFFSFCLFVVIVPVSMQLSRTLASIQNLLDTIHEDIEPAVKEIKQSVDDVRNTVKKCTSKVKSGINEANVFLVSTAYGLTSGIRDYFTRCKNNETSYNGNSSIGKVTER